MRDEKRERDVRFRKKGDRSDEVNLKSSWNENSGKNKLIKRKKLTRALMFYFLFLYFIILKNEMKRIGNECSASTGGPLQATCSNGSRSHHELGAHDRRTFSYSLQCVLVNLLPSYIWHIHMGNLSQILAIMVFTWPGGDDAGHCCTALHWRMLQPQQQPPTLTTIIKNEGRMRTR